MRAVGLAKRRVGAGGGTSPSFLNLTSWARPTSLATTPAALQKPFTNRAGLDSAIAAATGGEYIYYNGSGVYPITAASGGNVYPLANKNPTVPITIDFGCSHNIWDPSTLTGNYVSFNYTGPLSGQTVALYMHDCSNLNIYGGDFSGYSGLKINAPCHDINMLDGYFHDIGGNGMLITGTTTASTASATFNLTVRAEVYRWSLNPGLDNHLDRGTGFHAVNLHGKYGDVHDSTFAIYGHDPLQPGAFSAGQTWPEGGGGCVIEAGNDSGSNESNLTLYARGENLKMIPNATNFGSTGTGQTGGNIINLWGNVKLNGLLMPWIEGTNCTGAMVKQATGSYYPTSPAMKVSHGRASNMNQSTAGTNVAATYPTTAYSGAATGIVYEDCTGS